MFANGNPRTISKMIVGVWLQEKEELLARYLGIGALSCTQRSNSGMAATKNYTKAHVGIYRFLLVDSR